MAPISYSFRASRPIANEDRPWRQCQYLLYWITEKPIRKDFGVDFNINTLASPRLVGIQETTWRRGPAGNFGWYVSVRHVSSNGVRTPVNSYFTVCAVAALITILFVFSAKPAEDARVFGDGINPDEVSGFCDVKLTKICHTFWSGFHYLYLLLISLLQTRKTENFITCWG